MTLFGTVGEKGAITHPDTCAATGQVLRRNIGYTRVNLPNHANVFVGVWPGIRIRPDRLAELEAEYVANLPTPSPDEEPADSKPEPAPTDKPPKRKTAPKKD